MMAMSARPDEEVIRRKVTASGVIWLDGRAYYISRRLAGRTVAVTIGNDKLVVDTMIPLHKEYSLPRSGSAPRRPRGWRAARPSS
jgi:hypothetical protein